MLGAGEVARQILRDAAAFERDLRCVRATRGRRAANDGQQSAPDSSRDVERLVLRNRIGDIASRRAGHVRLGDDHAGLVDHELERRGDDVEPAHARQ